MDEAVEMYKKLMDQENEILSQNKELWEKVFMAGNKRDMTLQEDGKNYGDFLLDTIEFAKDDFTDKEYKILKEGAEKIKELEDQLAALEEKFPRRRRKGEWKHRRNPERPCGFCELTENAQLLTARLSMGKM
ncbi:MAG: hypothetical protein V8Q42_07080 [Anaerovoracaceae bacterium]